MLLAGCGGQPEQDGHPPAPTALAEPSSASPSPTASLEKVRILDSCLALFDTGGSAVEADNFLRTVESLDADTAREATEIQDRLEEVSVTAQPELAAAIEDLSAVLEDFAYQWEISGTFSLEPDSYQDVRFGILDICQPVVNAADADNKANQEPTGEPAPMLTEDEQAEQAFLSGVRSLHPNLEKFTDEDLVKTARNFCLIYSKPEGAPVVEELITKVAGLKYSLAELRSMNHAGVETLCPEHSDKLG